MVGHGHTESLSGIDVSSRVTLTLGVFHLSAFLCRRDRGEEEQSGAQSTEKLLPISVESRLHCYVPLTARSHSAATRLRPTAGLEQSSLFFFFAQVFPVADILVFTLLPSSGINQPIRRTACITGVHTQCQFSSRKNDSSKCFEWILIYFCRGVEWGNVNSPLKFGLHPPMSSKSSFIGQELIKSLVTQSDHIQI